MKTHYLNKLLILLIALSTLIGCDRVTKIHATETLRGSDPISFFGWWPNIIAFIKKCWLAVISDVSIPFWLMLILSVLSIIFILRIVIKYLSSRTDSNDWKKYTLDEIYDVKWRWTYYYNEIGDIVPFCPNCDFQISPRFCSSYRAVDCWEYHCENCGQTATRIEESLDAFQSRVVRQIQRKLRNGEWRSNNETA